MVRKLGYQIFSLKSIQGNFALNFGNTIITPVDCHKHLGITFSQDCKWTKHVDRLIETSGKQINVLRKLKFRLKREYLEKIYFTFIRPILEYSSEVWDNCGHLNSDRLEKIQLEAARIVCGFTSYASLETIYKETGWEKLATRRKVRKILMFYKIVKNQAPDYLQDLLPPLVGEVNNYFLRNRQNITIPFSRTSVYQHSFFPSSIESWNSLDMDTRQSTPYSLFKSKIQNIYLNNKAPPAYFYAGDRILSIIHTRLRNNCSCLKYDLYRSMQFNS